MWCTVSPTDVITRVAGTSDAHLKFSSDVAMPADDGFLIADTGNDIVCAVSAV